MEKNVKSVASVSLPVAALVVALSAGDARAQANQWSVSFDLGTQGEATDLDSLAGTGLESINDESRRWSMPITAA